MSLRATGSSAALTFVFVLSLFLHGAAGELAADNVIVKFNNAAQDDVRALGIQNQLAAKFYALVHLSQHLAIESAPRRASEKVLAGRAAYAAHAVLNLLVPWRFNRHDAVLAPFAAALPANYRSTASKDGAAIAAALVSARTTDGTNAYVNFVPSPAGGPPGKYQYVTGQTFTLYPQLATSRPFVIKNIKKYDVGPPNALNSTAYTTDLKEVFTYGVKSSPLRTQYQTDTPKFWADGATTSAIGGHVNQIAQKVISATAKLADVARFFAQANVASFDASVAGWEVKHKYLFWRPETAIRQGDGIAANALYVNATWTPEIATPPHPEYASGHQYTSAAFIRVLIAFLRKDAVSFTIGTEFPGLAERSFTSLTQAVQEVGDSRVLGGIHFRLAVTNGAKLGQKVADDVLANWRKADWNAIIPKAFSSRTLPN